MTKEISRWADEAMWLAPPIGNNGEPVQPKAYLLSMTKNPLKVMAAAAELYQGRVVTDPADVSDETAEWWFGELSKTKLAAPFEFIDFHFLLEGVSRAFTHQLVRQRTAVYVQESMRFAVKEEAGTEIIMPPSIASLPEGHPHRVAWTDTMVEIGASYNRLVNSGIPAEDARGILPTNIATRVHYKTNLRNLADHAGNRLCTQAQFEWRLVWSQMIKAIREYHADATDWRDWKHQRWQLDLICTLFRPVCFQTGRCGFDSAADRTCKIRPRVKAHEAKGDHPKTWTDIADWEWLADSTAARK